MRRSSASVTTQPNAPGGGLGRGMEIAGRTATRHRTDVNTGVWGHPALIEHVCESHEVKGTRSPPDESGARERRDAELSIRRALKTVHIGQGGSGTSRWAETRAAHARRRRCERWPATGEGPKTVRARMSRSSRRVGPRMHPRSSSAPSAAMALRRSIRATFGMGASATPTAAHGAAPRPGRPSGRLVEAIHVACPVI